MGGALVCQEKEEVKLVLERFCHVKFRYIICLQCTVNILTLPVKKYLFYLFLFLLFFFIFVIYLFIL